MFDVKKIMLLFFKMIEQYFLEKKGLSRSSRYFLSIKDGCLGYFNSEDPNLSLRIPLASTENMIYHQLKHLNIIYGLGLSAYELPEMAQEIFRSLDMIEERYGFHSALIPADDGSGRRG
jgi:hypothetical protein